MREINDAIQNVATLARATDEDTASLRSEAERLLTEADALNELIQLFRVSA